MAVIEIQTIEGGRLEWVGVFSGPEKDALEWGDKLQSGFPLKDPMRPHIRILARQHGKVIGAWQQEGVISPSNR